MFTFNARGVLQFKQNHVTEVLYMHNDIEGKLVYTRCKAKLVLETLEYNQYTQP